MRLRTFVIAGLLLLTALSALSGPATALPHFKDCTPNTTYQICTEGEGACLTAIWRGLIAGVGDTGTCDAQPE